jgi:hypothetical protein
MEKWKHLQRIDGILIPKQAITCKVDTSVLVYIKTDMGRERKREEANESHKWHENGKMSKCRLKKK